jgi:hypothetical protein
MKLRYFILSNILQNQIEYCCSPILQTQLFFNGGTKTIKICIFNDVFATKKPVVAKRVSPPRSGSARLKAGRDEPSQLRLPSLKLQPARLIADKRVGGLTRQTKSIFFYFSFYFCFDILFCYKKHANANIILKKIETNKFVRKN